jgi:glycerol dehydrogenase-like iron-containing ADH family enzyme
MTLRKMRLTVTVDRALIQAGSAAVAAGRADSVSGWVNVALAERAAKERKLEAMATAVALYEREFGTISDAELIAQDRADRRAAVVVRSNPRSRRKRSRGSAASKRRTGT